MYISSDTGPTPIQPFNPVFKILITQTIICLMIVMHLLYYVYIFITYYIFCNKWVKEWSFGELRSAFGEINIEPDIQDEKGAYSIELKCSPSYLNDAVDKNESISITDQIIFVVVVAVAYKLFTYFLSWFHFHERVNK